MSLDIDYDIVFTEPAPLDALIQRFGRVNRKRTKGIAPCVVFEENHSVDQYIYPKAVVGATLAELRSIVQNSEGVIHEQKMQFHLDKIYQGWEPEAKKQFQETYQYLSQSVQSLTPFVYDNAREQDFYQQFDGIPVLPTELKDEFLEKLLEFDFIGANSLKVQIRKNQYMNWLRNQEIDDTSYIFESEGREIKIDYAVTNKKYDSELGLMKDQTVPWRSTEIL